MNRIKELRISKGMKQVHLCSMLGVTQGALSGWENERYEPDIGSLKKMAEIFGVSIDYILNREDNSTTTSRTGIKIPVLGNVAAGIPIEAIEDIIDYEEIDEEMAKKGEYFGLKIKGDSMEPRIQNGDVVIVRKQETAESGDTAIVLVNGNDATVKKIKITEDGITLIPNNPAFDVKFYTKKEIEALPVRIIGKVVELRGKF